MPTLIITNEPGTNLSVSLPVTRLVTVSLEGPQGPAGAGPQGDPGSTDANALTGTILAPNVVTSSLTTVGTLSGLTVTAPIAGSVTGNAATATALVTPRAINGVNFDGSAPITVPAAAGTLTGTILAAGVVTSSLTTVGTLSGLTVTAPIVGSVTGAAGSVDAADLTGTILDSGVVTSSLTTVGTLSGLTVTAAIAGSVTGAAGSVPAANLTGTILAANVVTSSLTTVGTLSSLTVSGAVSASNLSGTNTGDQAPNVFIQPSAPSGVVGNYLWVETGLGAGTDFTFWVEDGIA